MLTTERLTGLSQESISLIGGGLILALAWGMLSLFTYLKATRDEEYNTIEHTMSVGWYVSMAFIWLITIPVVAYGLYLSFFALGNVKPLFSGYILILLGLPIMGIAEILRTSNRDHFSIMQLFVSLSMLMFGAVMVVYLI